jgi:hypothetical protein
VANRAYLFSNDRLDAWDEAREAEGYYDSRWTIPLAWFYFFRPEDVCLVDVHYGDSQWQQVKLGAEKDSALTLFQVREPLLMSVIGHRISCDAVAEFVATVGKRPGRYLLMDPQEVLGGLGEDDEAHAKRFTEILSTLGDGQGSTDAARAATLPYVGEFETDPDRCVCQVLGYTYW